MKELTNSEIEELVKYPFFIKDEPKKVKEIVIPMENKKSNGMLIVFDGIDGSGKTTQVEIIGNKLKELGFPIYRTSEPSQNEYGQLMRKRLKEPHNKLLDPHIDALLFTLDRYDHCMREIIPELNKNHIVLTDRYYYSTIAYQSAQGVDNKWLYWLNNYINRPNIVFIFDIDPKIALNRINNRELKERFEKEAFLKKVRNNFLKIGKTETETIFKIIDATKPIEDITQFILDTLNPYLDQWRKLDKVIGD